MEINKEVGQLNEGTWKDFIRENILEGETLSAKIVDFLLMLIILASITVAVLDTIPSVKSVHGLLLWNLEIFFTVVFTAEYILRVTCAKRPTAYIFSVSGLIDLISLSPLYLSIIFKGNELLNLIRALRLVRIFSRLIKMSKKIGNKSYFMRKMMEHLGTNEKIVYYFKSSRRKFLLGYVLAYALLILSFSEIFFNYISSSIEFNKAIVKITSYVLLSISIFLIARYEIKIVYVRYAITSHRVLRSEGIIHENFKSTNFAYVADTLLYQSFWQKIIVIGEVKIKTTGNDYENLNLDDISNPMKIKKVIHDSIIRTHEMNRGSLPRR